MDATGRGKTPSGALWLLLALVLPGAGVAYGYEGVACTAPGNTPGVCKPIRECPPMLQLLTGRPSQENLNVLNRFRCGFHGNQPVVCCPDDQAPPPPPSPPPPPPPPPPGTELGSTPADVSGHPNLRLLPMDYCSPGGTDRIVGGKVADVFAYPWIARLGYRSRRNPNRGVSYHCGGSLISSRYVLTAAHCIDTGPELTITTVKLGEHTIGRDPDCRTATGGCIPSPIDVAVESATVHPLYNGSVEGNHHDIAIVRLARPIDFTQEEFVRPVCLPVSAGNQNLRLEGTPLVVAGWGLTELRQGSAELKDVLVPVMPQEQCKAVYAMKGLEREIIPQQLCAGGVAGKDSCNGDSGGPLMLETEVGDEAKTVQFGVVSFGHSNCGTAGVPGVYTRVAFYVKWMLDTMRP